MRKDILLELVTETIVNGDLNLLDDHDNCAAIVEVVGKVGGTEHIVQVVVETVLLLVDDEHLVDLLHNLLLEAIVDNLKVLLLDLDDLLLVVEVVEAVNEVESLATEAVVESITNLALGKAGSTLGCADGFGSCGVH